MILLVVGEKFHFGMLKLESKDSERAFLGIFTFSLTKDGPKTGKKSFENRALFGSFKIPMLTFLII